MIRAVYRVAVFLALVGVPALQVEGAKVSLPLEGYYRAGRYMPVAFSEGQGQMLTLSADGAVTTVIESATGGVAPWLPLRDDLKTGVLGRPLHCLGKNERLIGSQEDEIPGDLFPGKEIVRLRLDSAESLTGPVAAWQTLDAVVLEYKPGELEMQALLGGGTSIAVRQEKRPDPFWPWRPDGKWWVLDSPSRLSGRPSDGAYDCLAGWAPASYWPFRREVVLMGVLSATIILGLRLWRSRWAAWCAVGLSVVGGAGILVWGQSHGMTNHVVAEVDATGTLLQWDQWNFWRAGRTFELQMPWDGSVMMRPILPEHDTDEIELRCGADGQPREIDRRMEAGHAFALVFEKAGWGTVDPYTQPVNSPMRRVVEACYRGYVVLGQSPGSGGAVWPTVWIGNNPATRKSR